MSQENNPRESWESWFLDHLQQEGYSSKTIGPYLAASKRFLSYLRQRGIPIEVAKPATLDEYFRARIEDSKKRHGSLPGDLHMYRHSLLRGVPILLRLAQGKWPPQPNPLNGRDAFHRFLSESYAQWLAEDRGLAAQTISGHVARSRHFLEWLGLRSAKGRLQNLRIADVDAYLEARAPQLERSSRAGLAYHLRSFLSYLHDRGWVARELASAVTGPTLYAFESMPVAFTQDEVARVLEVTYRDRSRIGLRDYAILLLLSVYGLRAGEVVSLHLEDLDWRHQRLRVYHSKTRTESILPLLPPVGNAIVDYLRHGRPKTTARHLFIRAKARYRPFQNGSSLHNSILRRLHEAGIDTKGRRGPHAFRHACAVTLLKGAVPLKTIGDILGHRKLTSTLAYLKSATANLRDVGLEIPKEVKP